MAKKKESTLVNMLVALLVIAAVSGGVLGLVYGVTKDAIAQGEEKKNNDAIKAVLPLKEVTYTIDTIIYTDTTGVTTAFPCTRVCDSISGDFKGMAIKTSEGGFGGKIDLMVGITADDTIRGISVLSHSETPGLGANMDKVLVGQFADKKPGDHFSFQVTKTKEKGKVDAITAATITSKAFTKAVEKAYEAFKANKANYITSTPVVEETPVTEETPVEENNETMEGGQDNE